MDEFEYTYEDYLRDLQEEIARENMYEDELDYTYEDYLRDQLPDDELYDPGIRHISHSCFLPSARELKCSKGKHIFFWNDPKDKNTPYQTYLEFEDGIARIVIEESDW